MAANNQQSGLAFLKDWGAGLTNWTERYIPDALVIVWILSIITFIMALIWGDVGPAKAVQAWGKGFWILLKFGMQMCLIMMTGYILACSPPVRRLMNGLSGLPNREKPWQAIMLMAIFSRCQIILTSIMLKMKSMQITHTRIYRLTVFIAGLVIPI